MKVLDFERLDRLAAERRDDFANADPFPHIAIDDFLEPEAAEAVLAEFDQPAESWKHYYHYNEKKLALTELDRMPPRTREVFETLQSSRVRDFITRLSGIEGLLSDPTLEGAGMHKTEPGGYLNIHTDFLTHTKNRNWRRHINLLIYLNKHWEDDWNGNLELWDKDMTRCVSSVNPAFNRCVLFNTIPKSYHGHPHKLSCPPGETRKHILLYYYGDEGAELALTPTDYQALPSDSAFKKAMVGLDGALLRAYTFLKGRTRLSDRTLDRLLKRF